MALAANRIARCSLLFAVVVSAMSLVSLGNAAYAKDYTIKIVSKKKGFDPSALSITVGDTVTWMNVDTDDDHTATADDDSPVKFTEVVVASGTSSAPVTFNTAGEVRYHCRYHPVMTGAISVKPAAKR